MFLPQTPFIHEMQLTSCEHAPLIEKGYSEGKMANLLHKRLPVLSKKEYTKLVSFIENEEEIDKTTSQYIEKEIRGIPCFIEYDVDTAQTFIHLKDHAKIAAGYFKKVTKSILYDRKDPVVLADASGCSCCLKKDLLWIDRTKNIQGVSKVVAVTSHQIVNKGVDTKLERQHTEKIISILYKYYNRGSLGNFIKKNQGKISFKDKLRLASDILEGVKNLHEQNIIHSDIKPDNILVHKDKRGIKAVLTDFGSAYINDQQDHIKKHGHSTFVYSTPEAFMHPEKIGVEDYKKVEMYAVGCCLYKLFHEKSAPWVHLLLEYRQHNKKRKFNEKLRNRVISSIRAERKELVENHVLGHEQAVINKLIFDLVTPFYKRRMSAKDAYKRVQSIKK